MIVIYPDYLDKQDVVLGFSKSSLDVLSCPKFIN